MVRTFTNLELSALRSIAAHKTLSHKKAKKIGVNLDAVYCLIHQFKEQLVIEIEGVGYQATDAGRKALEPNHG